MNSTPTRESIHELEWRWDRSYDEQGPSHIWHPNGTLMCTLDRTLGAALVSHAWFTTPSTP